MDDQAINESAPAPLDVDPFLARIGYLIAQGEWRAFLADQATQREQAGRWQEEQVYARQFADLTAKIERLATQVAEFEEREDRERGQSAQAALEQAAAEARARIDNDQQT